MKKKISMLMCLIIAAGTVSCLAGCNGDESASGDTLLWYCIGDTPADNATVLAKANEIIEPEIGMKLDIQYIDTASFSEKMKLKMAAGEEYDLTFTGYINPYQTAVSLGGLYDITDLVEEVNMSEVIEQFYLDSAMVNGRIYGIPNIQVVSNPQCLQMGKPLAEECGIDLSPIHEYALNAKTYEDVEKMMNEIDKVVRTIHEKRPDLYAVQPGIFSTNALYEEIAGGVVLRKDGSTNELVCLNQTDEWKLGVDMVAKWYQDGCIRPDIASKSTATTTEEYKQIGLSTTTWKPGQDVYYIKDYGYEPVYAFLAEPYVGRTTPLLTMVSVGANSKHPKEAVELIKLMNTNEELYNIICWGIKDVHYTMDEEGKVAEIPDSGYNGIGQNAWRYGNQFKGYIMQGQPDTVWEETENMNNTARKSPALGFVPDTDVITNELANITNVTSEYKARIEYGTAPREAYYDEYLQKMEQAGQQKVLEELQKQYDEFLASK